MNYQERYQKARESGYSDEEIMEYLSKKDNSFGEKIEKAKSAGYTPQEVLSYFNTPVQKKELSSIDYAKDFGKQTAEGIGIGALGTYGDILDLFGLQSKEILPAEKAKYGRESDILEKIEQGKAPSFGELLDLSEDNDIAPRFSRLPSSQEVEEFGSQLGLVSEPKTAAGRYGKRIGKIGGAGLSVGATGIASPIAAGITGQTLEEAGAPAWAQVAGEIIAGLKFSPKTKVTVSSKSPEVEKVIGDLRKAGYTEKDITLAKSALEKRNILKKYASLTPEAENSIIKSVKNSEELFKEQVKKGLPTYVEGGIPALEREASGVYQSMEELASSVPIKNKEPVKKSIEDAIAYLEKYPLLDEQKKFIEFMKDGLMKLDKADTADFFTGFYRNLGKAGNWGDPKQKEHLLGLVKKGIKDTFSESGKEAANFGRVFEETNTAWKNWLNARDLMQNLEKAQNLDGMNFKKLASTLNDSKNHELAKKVLGPEQTKNIKSISEGANAIESLLKQVPKSDKGTEQLKLLAAIHALLIHGNRGPISAYVGVQAAKRYATSLLFDPEKQNRMKRLIVAAKNNSLQQASMIAQEIAKTDFSQTKEEQSPQK